MGKVCWSKTDTFRAKSSRRTKGSHGLFVSPLDIGGDHAYHDEDSWAKVESNDCGGYPWRSQVQADGCWMSVGPTGLVTAGAVAIFATRAVGLASAGFQSVDASQPEEHVEALPAPRAGRQRHDGSRP